MWKLGASMASCRLIPPTTWRSRNSDCHWSCWSPPGEPHASTGTPSRSTSVGVSVVRGRAPGTSEAGSPSSSQNICARLPRQKPSSGIVGELCSQPPLGVAETRLPQRSTTSMWQVSPRVVPSRCTVGSPVVTSAAHPVASPASSACTWRDRRGSRPPGLPGRTPRSAVSPTRAARLATYSGSSRSCTPTGLRSPNQASRSAIASFQHSATAWMPISVAGSSASGPSWSSIASTWSSAGPWPQRSVLATWTPCHSATTGSSQVASYAARSSPPTRPGSTSPPECRHSVARKASTASATKPRPQASRAACAWAATSDPAAVAASTSRSSTEA